MPKKEKDPRADHPIIQALRILLCRYPNKVLWDDLIVKFGESFDNERLTQCFKVWVARGFKEINLAWATDWYFNGVPDKEVALAVPKIGNLAIVEEAWESDDFNSWIDVQELLNDPEDFRDKDLYEQWRDAHLKKRPQDLDQVLTYQNGPRYAKRFGQTEPAGA